LVSDTLLKVPSGLNEICEVYGDPYRLMGSDGIMQPPELAEWESRLTYVALPRPIPLAWDFTKRATRIRCHQAAAESFRSAFRILDSEDELWRHVKTYGGTYNFRTKRKNGTELSTHSWGIAIDLNPGTNQAGTEGDMHPGIVQAFEACGFQWGGRWRTRDDMHFQLCRGY
jgi:hypothetical protein